MIRSLIIRLLLSVVSILWVNTYLLATVIQPFNLQITDKHLDFADGLGSRQINTTFIDKHNRLWFLVNNRIGLFEYGKITNFQLSDSFSNKGFNSAFEDNKGNFWLTENYEWYYPFNVQRCIIFNPITKKSIPLEQYISPHITIHSIVNDDKKQLFISTLQGQIYRFDAQKRTLHLIKSFPNTSIKLLYTGNQGIVACIEQNAKNDKTLLQLDLNGQIIQTINIKGLFVRSVIEVKNKLFYITQHPHSVVLRAIQGNFTKTFACNKDTYLSTIIYNKNKNYFVVNGGNILSFFDENFKLVKKNTYDLLIHHVVNDAFGNYILATNNGVNIVQLKERKIRTFLQNTDASKINDNVSCRKIIKIDNDHIIVNTNKMRRLINLNTNKVTFLNNFKNQHTQDWRFVLTALKTPQGELLFGEDALVKTNLKTMTDEVICNIDSTKIWAIAAYQEGYLLGLEKRGIIYYNLKQKKAYPLTHINHAFDNAIVYDFFVDNQQFFIASEAGFYQFSKNTINKINFPMKGGLQMTCFSLQQDKKNPTQLLIATVHGLWIYHIDTHLMSPFIRDKRYHNNKYLSMYRTKNGIWASSEEGIWHFDDNGNLLKIYTTADGLTTNECNRLAHFQDENDVLYFGGINGVNSLNPSDFSTKQSEVFTVKIDSIYTYKGDTQVSVLTNHEQQSLHLTRSENALKLIFSYEDFKYDCPKKYYYRSDRFLLKDWQLLIDHTLLLTNLDHGNTTLEIMVVSCDNFTDAKIKKIVIHRDNPLYLMWYFWLMIVSLIGFLVAIIIKYSTYQLKRRNAYLQHKIDEQTHSLKESLALKETLLSLLVHDVRYPVQSFYNFSKKLAYLTQKNDHERLFLLGKETENKSRKVLWLIDELVYWVKSTQKKWQPTLQECALSDIVHQIFDTYEDEYLEKKLSYILENSLEKVVVDQSLLIIIMRNLIFNAIIHAKPNTTIVITVLKNKDKTQIIITNEFDVNKNIIETSLGVGMTILLPILKEANFVMETTQDDVFFRNKLYF